MILSNVDPSPSSNPIDQLIQLAKTQIDWQLRASDALDLKTGTLLAFNSVVLGTIVGLRSVLNGLWWIPLTLIGMSCVVSLLALNIDDYYTGPDAATFYNLHSSDAFEEHLLADLSDAVSANTSPVLRKGGLWFTGVWLSVAAMVAGVLVAVVHC